MAKRAVENLCCLYAAEYGVPAKVARLTQTTGAGISRDDNRVIAQFARLVAQGQDIVLHTTGESARPYCYLMDCISAILFILLKGNPGESYNVANEETYISARGMAEYLKQHFNPSIQIRVELNGSMGYAPATKQRLSAQKLRNLGWEPEYPLHRIFERLIAYLKS
jgi:nucleoside-diphosphate-sugar epimerase